MASKAAKAAGKSVDDMFASITAQLEALAGVPANIAKLESLVVELKTENTSLRAELLERDKEIITLRSHLNNVDQYNRQWSIRIFNLPIPPADSRNNFKVAQFTYDTVLQPILAGAVLAGEIPEVPPCHLLLERAHILPGAGDKPGSVIARFLNRDYRQLIFKYKRDFQPREPSSGPLATRSNRPGSKPVGRFLYPIHEDLTKATFSKMRALSAHTTVQSAWSHNGSIRFTLVGDSANTIHRVLNVFDSVESILAK